MFEIVQKHHEWLLEDTDMEDLASIELDTNFKADSSDEEFGRKQTCCEQLYEFFTCPLVNIFAITSPKAGPKDRFNFLYPLTFFTSVLWIAAFSFVISSIVERWVHVLGLPMEFFGLLFVSVAAQIPDMFESLAAAQEGLGSMAVANCIGSQVINIGLGLGIPWLITLHTGYNCKLDTKLIKPCYILLGMILFNFCVLYYDVCLYSEQKVYLTTTKCWILILSYIVAVGSYAGFLFVW